MGTQQWWKRILQHRVQPRKSQTQTLFHKLPTNILHDHIMPFLVQTEANKFACCLPKPDAKVPAYLALENPTQRILRRINERNTRPTICECHGVSWCMCAMVCVSWCACHLGNRVK